MLTPLSVLISPPEAVNIHFADEINGGPVGFAGEAQSRAGTRPAVRTPLRRIRGGSLTGRYSTQSMAGAVTKAIYLICDATGSKSGGYCFGKPAQAGW
jgi:hypothetical protein